MSGGRSARPRERREMIVAAAAELFHTKGFRATRIEDIGAAVGMTGPALYRHFESKEALLTELLERYWQRAAHDTRVARQGRTPRETLRLMMRAAVTHVVDDGPLVATARTQLAHLPPAARRRIERRHRAIVDQWVDGILAVRDDVDAEEARVIAIGISAMVTAAAQEPISSREKIIERLTRMAMAALFAR